MAPSEEDSTLKFLYFRFDQNLKNISEEDLKGSKNVLAANIYQNINIPTAIKGFLSGKAQSGGSIMQIIDVDAPPTAPL